MAIYNPRLFLSGEDRELLRLLAELLVICDSSSGSSNLPTRAVPLSDSEASQLLRLLESFVLSKKFVEGSYFIEKLFSDDDLYNRQLRDIYLAWRRRLGRSRAVATVQWENLLGRLGLWTTERGNPNVWYRASAAPMDFDYFLKMEQRLATAADLNPRVRALLLEFVAARETAVNAVRFGRIKLQPGQINKLPKELLEDLKTNAKSPVGMAPIPAAKIAGVMTIVLDFAAIFTTRDWSVTSFISTVAGALPAATTD